MSYESELQSQFAPLHKEIRERKAENERLRTALRLARSDLVDAIKEIDRELTIHLSVSNGDRGGDA